MKFLHSARTLLSRNLALVLGLVCLAFVVHEIFGANGWLAMRREQRESQSLQQKIQQLQQQKVQLEQQIQGLKSNPQAIEKAARQELHLAKPGEIIYTLPPPKQKAAANR